MQIGAGSVVIGSLEDPSIILKTFDGSVQLNIFNLVHRIDIWESIDNYTLYAEFIIIDAVELIDQFPLVGEEIIEMTLMTPATQRPEITFEFLVDQITNISSNIISNFKTYKLRCVTKDFLTNASRRFTKRYRDKTYEDSIREVIYEDLNSTKSLNLDPTIAGTFDYMVNNVRPFQVIDLLTERSHSKKHLSDYFVFYEDREGYNFTTIEQLISERKEQAQGTADPFSNNPYHYWFSTSKNNLDYEKSNRLKEILFYEQIGDRKGAERVRNGGMYNQIREFDISTGTYYTRGEYLPGLQSAYQNLDGSYDVNSAAYRDYVSKYPARTYMVVKDSTRPEMMHNMNIPYIGPFREKIMQYGVRIRTYGDTLLKPGDCIKINIQEISGKTENMDEESHMSAGRYLIKEIRHVMEMNATNTFTHYMIIDARKPHLPQPVAHAFTV